MDSEPLVNGSSGLIRPTLFHHCDYLAQLSKACLASTSIMLGGS